MLRNWNPGTNEPREQARGEAEAEVVEIAGRGRGRGRRASRRRRRGGRGRRCGQPTAFRRASDPLPRRRRRSRRAPTPRSTSRPAPRPVCTFRGGPTGGSPAAPRPYRSPWSNPILWRELDDPRLRNQAADHQGLLRPALRAGGRLLLHLGQGLEQPAGHATWASSRGPGHPQPDPGQRPGRDGPDQRARHRGTRPAAGHRALPGRLHLRQALRHPLQQQGDGRAAILWSPSTCGGPTRSRART